MIIENRIFREITRTSDEFSKIRIKFNYILRDLHLTAIWQPIFSFQNVKNILQVLYPVSQTLVHAIHVQEASVAFQV